jgi:hypothetical protein
MRRPHLRKYRLLGRIVLLRQQLLLAGRSLLRLAGVAPGQPPDLPTAHRQSANLRAGLSAGVCERSEREEEHRVGCSQRSAACPSRVWSYRDEPSDVRHMGPMAQDFRASFGLGNDDRSYFAIDAQGVALAAIQALDHQLAAQRLRIETLERENRELGRRLRALDRGKE